MLLRFLISVNNMLTFLSTPFLKFNSVIRTINSWRFLRFPPFVMYSNEAYFTTWHLLYIFIVIPIVFGNSLILISVFRFKKLHTNINVLVANLAVSDFIIGALLIPIDVIGDLAKFNLNKYYCLGKLSLFVLSLGQSCFNLMLISVERFIAIVYPLKKKVFLTNVRLTLMITLGWVLNILLSILPLLGWNTYGDGPTICVSDEIWTQWYKHCINWSLMIASIINVTLYTVVMKIALKRAASSRLNAEVNIHVTTEPDIHHLVTMVIVLGLFAVCWLPYLCMIVVVTFHETEWTQYIRRCTLIPGLFNSSINWVVYGYRNNDFRRAFCIVLRCDLCCGHCNADSESERYS